VPVDACMPTGGRTVGRGRVAPSCRGRLGSRCALAPWTADAAPPLALCPRAADDRDCFPPRRALVPSRQGRSGPRRVALRTAYRAVASHRRGEGGVMRERRERRWEEENASVEIRR
jgi:hypothetical protein